MNTIDCGIEKKKKNSRSQQSRFAVDVYVNGAVLAWPGAAADVIDRCWLRELWCLMWRSLRSHPHRRRRFCWHVRPLFILGTSRRAWSTRQGHVVPHHEPMMHPPLGFPPWMPLDGIGRVAVAKQMTHRPILQISLKRRTDDWRRVRLRALKSLCCVKKPYYISGPE